jgi:hypothetical protein
MLLLIVSNVDILKLHTWGVTECIYTLEKIIFPIYFDGTSKKDYRDAMYVLNNANCTVSENERETSYLV